MASRQIGQIFIDLGFVTGADVDEALDLQRAMDTLIGETLVSQGKLSRLDLASALSHQWYVEDNVPSVRQGRLPEPAVSGQAGRHGPVVDAAIGPLQAAVVELRDALARSEAARLADAAATDLRLAAIESALSA